MSQAIPDRTLIAEVVNGFLDATLQVRHDFVVISWFIIITHVLCSSAQTEPKLDAKSSKNKHD
jgi:hypothetical protein